MLFRCPRQSWAIRLTVSLSLFLPLNSFADSITGAIQYSESQPVAPLIPRSQFAGSASIKNETLSPNGQFLSYIRKKSSYSELWIVDLAKGQHRLLLAAKTMEQAFWSTDSSFVFVQNSNGISGIDVTPNAFAHLITEIDESKDQYFYGVDNSHNQAIIISEKNLKTQQHQLLRVTVDGAKEVLYADKKRVLDYLLDDSGQLIFIKQIGEKGADLYDFRSKSAKLLKHCDWYDNCSLQSFDGLKNTLLVKARFTQDLTSLFAINTITQKTQLVHQDPKQRFDLTKVYYDKDDEARLALYQDEFISQYGLDSVAEKQLRKFQQQLDPFTEAHTVWVFKPSANFKVWLALDISSNKSQRRLFVFNHSKNSLSQPLSPIYAAMKDEKNYIQSQHLASKVAVNYTTSDGMQQFGYLTLPLGRKISEVPLVVKPHGGPWSRVTGNYDPLTQLIANRGYAVFEPNFRASTGMGRHYVISAKQDFGKGRVQQDILDGLHYLLSQGVGDKTQLAIHGHSFGGFSTLTALTFTPDLFKVGIAGAPPSDMAQSVKLISQQPQNDSDLIGKYSIQQLSLNPDDKNAMLRFYHKSPDAHWQNIKQPLYIIAGGRDPKVAVARVKDFSIRLQQAQKPISLLVDNLEGHSPERDIAREGYMYVLEKALATHLNGVYEERLSPKLITYLQRNLIIDINAIKPK